MINQEVPVWRQNPLDEKKKLFKFHFASSVSSSNIFEFDCFTHRQSCEVQKQA
jgi:hypothetical protein